MLDRRYAIVAGLGIVELWIVGLALRSVAGGGRERAAEAVAAMPAAPYANHVSTFAAGVAPSVIIDDAAAAVTVTVRPGTDVTVDDAGESSAWDLGRRVRVERTSAGLTISRRHAGTVHFGWGENRLAVTVPPSTQLDVRDAATISVAGLRGDATLHSDAGRVVVSDLRGALRVRTDSGNIELSDIDSPSIDAGADAGRIKLDRVRAGRVTLAADAGQIAVERSVLAGGTVRADSGAIALGLEPQSNVTVAARTSDGRISVPAGMTVAPDVTDAQESTARTVRVGDGSGRLDVNTDSGTISIQTVGV